MRKIVVLIALVASVASVYAQQTQTTSLFLSDIMQTTTDRQTGQWPSGFGVSYERMFAPRWSVQAAVAVERHRSYSYVVEDNGAITFVDRARLQTVPIDVTARHHWPNDTRWKPYLGFGAHYVAAPGADARFRYRNHLDAEVDGGTFFMLTPAFGVMLDGRVILGDREPYDQPFKVSLGVSWRF
ncbi:MAG TPA: OmpW family outer membrane protein [Thermoanaerobaculia bacterium]|nr:OmpW family outer membrane protein [Thermoanaerobaculia bacterium]